MITNAHRFATLSLVFGFAVLGHGVPADATMMEFQLRDGFGGYYGSPSYGLQVNGSNQGFYGQGSYGNCDFFSFENGSGGSTMSMFIDTDTGCVTVSGQMRHGSTSWYGTKYSGEIWTYEACLQVVGDWSPRDLEACLVNDSSNLDDLCFAMDSSSFQLSSGYNKKHGYSGPAHWTKDTQHSSGDYHIGRNRNSNSDRYACQGWFSPFGYDGPKMFHDFGCDYTPPSCSPKTVVPEPASMSLLGLGLALLATRQLRKNRA